MTDNSKYFLTEAEIPENWEPAEPAPGVAAPPRPNPMPQFFSGSMPPGLQHDSTFVGTEVGSPRIPKHSLMPFGIQGRPSTNAGIHSTASKTLPAGGGTSGKIELVIPGSTLTPSDQTVDLPGPLAFDWVASPYGEVLATPPITGVGAYIDGAFSAKSLAASATFGMSLTPSQN